MAPQTRKRTQESLLGEATKRLRIEDELPAHDQATTLSEDDDSDGNFSGNEYDSSDDESCTRRSKTPLTPATRLSTVSPAPTPAPTKAKFPSQLKTIVCTYEGCTKTFNRPARLATHLLKHEGKKTFLCTYEGCDKAYFEQKHLTSHIKGSHIQERSYKCDWVGCEKSFLTATRLNRHRDAHQGHERFRCTSFRPCNQTFRKHQTLQRHIRSDHLNESPFPCTHVDPITNEECDSGFDAASKLKRHKEQVHGDLKFFCEECTIPGRTDANGSPLRLGFTTNVKLQAHIKSAHANCQFCERKCSSQRELQKHVESQHSGTSLEDRKTIACPYRGCDKKFTKKSNLNSHIKSAHQGLRFICGAFDLSKTRDLASWDIQDGCDQAFVSKANLEDHVRTAHLGLPSLINKNRKKPTFDEDEDEDEEGCDENYDLPEPPKKRKEVKEPSAMEKLLGLTYDDRRTISCIIPTCAHKFIREYDLQNHIRSKHRLSTPEIESMTGGLGMPEEPFGDPAFTEPSFGNTAFGGYLPEVERAQGFTDGQQMGSFFDGDDMDWEMQRRALEGGPFWIGGDETAIEMQIHSGWKQDEPEMRVLVDQTIDPSLR